MMIKILNYEFHDSNYDEDDRDRYHTHHYNNNCTCQTNLHDIKKKE